MSVKDIKGIKITFKDGSTDEIDPCENITIYNGFDSYEYEVDQIEKIETFIVEDIE